jgi:hypothetical protein
LEDDLALVRKLLIVLALASLAAPAGAAELAGQVERLEVISRSLAFGGARFGEVGQYEAIVAVAHMRIDPAHPANGQVVDLDKAPREHGVVRYDVDVVLLRPRDAHRASGVLLLDIPNRGGKLGFKVLNDAGAPTDNAAGAGNGFTLRRGHAMLWIGWQGDIALAANGLVLGTRFPVAGAHGQAITGVSEEEAVFDDTKSDGVINLTYPAASLDPAGGTLTVRRSATGEAIAWPGWRYTGNKQMTLMRPAGFDAGAIYQFRYTARDPIVMGLGMTALRDVASFFKAAAPDMAGQANPLADMRPALAMAVGVSQSGRMLRDFIWQGFNANPRGGKVFDAAMPLVAGSRKSFVNARFAQPGRYSTEHLDHLREGDQFPFSYAVTTDPVSGRSDGIFARCLVDSTCPKLMHIDSATEFWQGRSSLVGTDGAGKDIAFPDNVRAYLMASTQHIAAREITVGICKWQNNPARQSPMLRALLDRLADWARDGTAPPASRFPRIADAMLVAPEREAVGFPDLHAIDVTFPGVINALSVVDYARQPALPDLKRAYTLLVPMTDSDGNDIAGVRLPDVAAPLATYTGWNLRRAQFAESQLCDLNGSSVPFAATAREGDPRLPLAQRYPSRLAYTKAVAQAARALRDEGFLLDEDVAAYIERAQAERRLPP